MSGKQTVKNWSIIFVILVITSLVAGLWPLMMDTFTSESGGGAAVSAGIATLSLPFPLFGKTEMNALLVLLLLTAVVLVSVAIAGAAVAGINLFLVKQTDSTKADAAFKTRQSALDKRQTEEIKQMRQGRPAGPIPPHKMPRWSVVSNSLIVLFFVVALAKVLTSALLTDAAALAVGPLSWNVLIIGGLALLTVLILAWRMRPHRLEAIEATNNGPIPWDTIWILLSGLIVVGLGVGIVLYLNQPG